jgi:O-antigen ligase
VAQASHDGLNADQLDRVRAAVVALAVASPMLLAFSAPPSPTILNGLLALGLWGGVLLTMPPGKRAPLAPVAVPLAAVACVAMAALLATLFGALPAAIAVGAMAMLAAAAGVLLCAAAPLRSSGRGGLMRGFWWGIAGAGLLSALIAAIQVFAPDWPDGSWIARSVLPGRAGGNLRQPNHLSSLILWAMVASVALTGQHRRSTTSLLVAQALLLLLALVLTGSRTGILGTALLALWGLSDRRLPGNARVLLSGSPVLFALLWFAMTIWAHATGHLFGAEGHVALVASGDISSSRFAIWSNTLEMIRHEPWSGVGFGEFNLAWTLTKFPDRPTAFFDHTHNLPLQLLVEMGIPFGSLVIVLLLVALVQAGRRAWACDGHEGLARRAAFMIVLMIGLHSMLEYPLWYAYFLLPTAFAWGYALSRPGPAGGASGSTAPAAAVPSPPLRSAARGNRDLALAGLAMTVGAVAAVLDYWRVVVIYDPPENAAPLEDRIERGQRSPLFGHHADYAAATAFGEPKAPLSASQQLAFKRAPHQLLDVRLMIAWSQALAVEGEMDKARWLAARIREFRNPGADEFFAPCQRPEQAASAFQCQPPRRTVHWREFTQPR